MTSEACKQECGTCHFVYQPGLLPAGSWAGILTELPSHFGQEVQLGEPSRAEIGRYLRENAAEHTTVEESRGIIRSLKGQTPLRVTEVPYLRRQHAELSPEVFKRGSVGCASSCAACHTMARAGSYDDGVNVPG